MKNKKVLLVIVMFIAIILNSVNVVYADGLTVNVTSSKESYAPGETVTFKISLTNIDSSEGIYGLEGKLEYDLTIFEEIIASEYGETDQFTALNGWGNVRYKTEDLVGSDKNFKTHRISPTKTSQDIMQISLKIREDASLGKTAIMLKNLIATDSENNIPTSPATASITIKSASEIGGGSIPTIVTTPTPTAPETATPTSSPITVASPKVSPTPNTSNLPQTGIGDSPAPILFGALLICLVSYIAYRRYRDI